jgi:hypothetical protein
MKAALDEKNAEVQKLRTINASLTQSLQEKEQSIAKYVSLNQSLRGLLGDQPEEPVRGSVPAPRFDLPEYPTPSPKAVYGADTRFKTAPVRVSGVSEAVKPTPPRTDRPQASQGSLFIRAAKEELTYTEFNQMISEINRYNKQQQTREETIANVRQLLCPNHRTLFEQFLPMIGGK